MSLVTNLPPNNIMDDPDISSSDSESSTTLSMPLIEPGPGGHLGSEVSKTTVSASEKCQRKRLTSAYCERMFTVLGDALFSYIFGVVRVYVRVTFFQTCLGLHPSVNTGSGIRHYRDHPCQPQPKNITFFDKCYVYVSVSQIRSWSLYWVHV